MARFLFFPLLAFILAASISVLSAQQELVEQKAKSGEAFGEKAAKAGKDASKTVGGNYSYGKKAPPAEMKPKAKPVAAKAVPPVQKQASKEPLSTSEVAVGVLGLLLFPIFLAPVAKEAAEREAAGKITQ